MSGPKRASLLDLPLELRQQIYALLLYTPPDVQPFYALQIKRHYPPRPYGLRGSYVKAHEIPHSASQPQLQYPWTNLMLTCAAFATELRTYMASPAYLDNSESRTYVAELAPKDQFVSMTWCRLPCWPYQVRKLVLNVHGAANSILLVLNLFLHCGPSLNRSQPLKQHLSVAELVVNVTSERPLVLPQCPPGFEDIEERAHSKPEWQLAFRTLTSCHQGGRIGGYIGHVSVQDHQGNEESFRVDRPFRKGSVNCCSWGV